MEHPSHQERFLEAYDEHADRLFRHAYFRVSNRETALDLVQDAYTKTWDYVVKGGEVQDFKPFLYRTLNNLIIDEYRKRKTESLDARLEEEGADEGQFAALVVDGRHEVEIQFDHEAMLTELQALPATYKDIVVMRFVDEMMPQEIADMLSLNVNVISVRIHRGVALLKKRLAAKEKN